MELDNVPYCPKFGRQVPGNMLVEFFGALIRGIEIEEITRAVILNRDPQDDKFLD